MFLLGFLDAQGLGFLTGLLHVQDLGFHLGPMDVTDVRGSVGGCLALAEESQFEAFRDEESESFRAQNS